MLFLVLLKMNFSDLLSYCRLTFTIILSIWKVTLLLVESAMIWYSFDLVNQLIVNLLFIFPILISDFFIFKQYLTIVCISHSRHVSACPRHVSACWVPQSQPMMYGMCNFTNFMPPEPSLSVTDFRWFDFPIKTEQLPNAWVLYIVYNM